MTLTLTSDLVLRIIVSGHIFYILCRGNSKFDVCMHLWIQSVTYHFRVTVNLELTSDLVLIMIMSGRQVFSEIFFSKCGHFWGIRCH